MAKQKINVQPGDRYAYLTIVRFVGKTDHGQRQFLCKCDCGNHVTFTVSYLNQHKHASCGCKSKQRIGVSKEVLEARKPDHRLISAFLSTPSGKKIRI